MERKPFWKTFLFPPLWVLLVLTLLTATLVSMLALETAMFSQFGGDMAQESQQLMIALTGAAVSAVVIVLSVFMIVKTSHEIKEIENNGREKSF